MYLNFRRTNQKRNSNMRDYAGASETQAHEKPTARRSQEQETNKALHSGTVKGEGHDTDLMRNETIKPFVAELEQSL